jgi:hypothetical protein
MLPVQIDTPQFPPNALTRYSLPLSSIQANRYCLSPRDVDLGLAAFARGSLYLGFSLPPSDFEDAEGNRNLLGNEDPLFTATREAMKVLGVVARSLSSDEAQAEITAAIPDSKIRDTAMTAMQRIAPSGRKGVDAIEIGGRALETTKFTELTPIVRRTIRSLVKHHSSASFGDGSYAHWD